ncbi:flagellar hook-basal body complex protein [Shinella sp. AETb1-6]|uniref:flagellar hook protein FlgE n=1 Tax=Shinella sp. AETb1-6 TaxID=2692210 RepID=UPI00136BCAB8|nr:flagellar hook protein FlgE [Shinella sp. AETb1-6]MXN50083.1 flagellar hook-basal body complex protein [Shinella sp. AETb1-6]
MSLYGTMRTGVSGMNAQANRLSTVADNIANANTTGYKKASTQFSSLILPTTGGAYNSGGVTTDVRYSISAQGTFTYTTSATDLAINGQGFFIVRGTDGMEYMTRAGAFTAMDDGTLRNSAGFTLMGYEYSSTEDPTIVINGFAGLSEINLAQQALSATGSTSGVLDANLPANAEIGYSKSTSLTAFDSLGNTRLLDFTYTKIADNTWSVDVYYAGVPLSGVPVVPSSTAVVSGNLDASAPVGTTYSAPSTFYDQNGALQVLDCDYVMTTDGWEFTVSYAGDVLFSDQLHADEFDAAGDYLDPEDIVLPQMDLGGGVLFGPITISQVGLTSLPAPSTISQTFNGSPAMPGGIELQFDASGKLVTPASLSLLGLTDNGAVLNPLDIDISGSTQLAADFGVSNGRIDGNGASKVVGYEISDEGVIFLKYDNGELSAKYRIAMASVQSPDKLNTLPGNIYTQSNASGVVVMGYAGNGGFGAILSGALEDSNVDIAEELTSMIEAQRNYTANSKVFQTGSELMEVLVNLKR